MRYCISRVLEPPLVSMSQPYLLCLQIHPIMKSTHVHRTTPPPTHTHTHTHRQWCMRCGVGGHALQVTRGLGRFTTGVADKRIAHTLVMSLLVCFHAPTCTHTKLQNRKFTLNVAQWLASASYSKPHISKLSSGFTKLNRGKQLSHSWNGN